MGEWRNVTPAHCEHIARYYDHKWLNHMCLAWNLLRRGYRQWSLGRIEPGNNLYEVE